MEGMEIEGKTIDEAIENACSAFQVPREKLNIEIISEGTPGFLGLGAKKAQIRASLLSIEMTLDAPLRRAETKAPAKSAQDPPPRVEQAERKAVEPAAPKPHQAPAAHATTADGEPALEKARRILEGLLTRMQIESSVEAGETEDAIILNVQGEASGLLIGKRGQNLDAIQHIVNKAVHHSVNGHKMIIIDTEEYRKRREEALIALAMKIGEKVKKTKKPSTVGHLNAHDRRIIHLAMQKDEVLTTKSRGEGEYRSILILPLRRRPERTDA
jgi:spoIIIJ-associated protein